jgi:hypothetical protein
MELQRAVLIPVIHRKRDYRVGVSAVGCYFGVVVEARSRAINIEVL